MHQTFLDALQTSGTTFSGEEAEVFLWLLFYKGKTVSKLQSLPNLPGGL